MFGVPCSKIKEKIQNIDVPCSSEVQAMGMAAGMALAGKESTVYMQNSGLPSIVDIVCSLYHPYNITLPKLILSIRHSPKHHEMMGEITRDLLLLMNYTSKIEITEEKI